MELHPAPIWTAMAMWPWPSAAVRHEVKSEPLDHVVEMTPLKMACFVVHIFGANGNTTRKDGSIHLSGLWLVSGVTTTDTSMKARRDERLCEWTWGLTKKNVPWCHDFPLVRCSEASLCDPEKDPEPRSQVPERITFVLVIEVGGQTHWLILAFENSNGILLSCGRCIHVHSPHTMVQVHKLEKFDAAIDTNSHYTNIDLHILWRWLTVCSDSRIWQVWHCDASMHR